MDSGMISRAEHEEFTRRMEDEHKRQDARIKILEENVREMLALTTSVEKLASNMENMVKEQEKQGERLGALEGRDGEKWRTVVSYVVTTVVGLVIGFVINGFLH